MRDMTPDKPGKNVVKTERRFEVSAPLGVQLVNVMFWISGLSGIVLGTLTLSQAAYESYYDMTILESVQGIAIVGLGAAMFIVATGLTSGARWSLDAARRVVMVAIIWSVVGISLALYAAMNMPGVATAVLYGNVIWLIVFGIALGILCIRYLYMEDISLRKYTEYVGTEIARPEDIRGLPSTRYVPTYDMLPSLIQSQQTRPGLIQSQQTRPVNYLRKFCWNCGAVLRENETVCPKCGISRDVQ
jgi:ribosomal protein S27AE